MNLKPQDFRDALEALRNWHRNGPCIIIKGEK